MTDGIRIAEVEILNVQTFLSPTHHQSTQMQLPSLFKAAATVAAALGLAISSLGAFAQEASRFDTVMQRGKLIMVTMSTIPPLAFKDDKGDLVGFDVEVARLMATALFKDPTKVEFVQVSGEGRWPAIQSGQADFGQATIYMERANNVAFARPHLDTRITLLVSTTSGVKSLADVNSPKITVANLNNPQMAARAKQFFPKATVLAFDSGAAQFLAVQSGRAQALQMDSPIAEHFALQNKGKYTVLSESLGPMFANGFYAKTGDFKWWLWLDTFAQEITTGSLHGEYAEIYRKWFGKEPPAQRFYQGKK